MVPMVSTVAAIMVIAFIVVLHLRMRRHPGWWTSADGRYYVTVSYPMLAIAVYWLTSSPTGTDWEWALGNAWALAAAVSFVYGHEALDRVPKEQEAASRAIESIANPPASQPEIAGNHTRRTPRGN
jgi:hypothetical protein